MTHSAPKIIGLCGPKQVGKSTYAKTFDDAIILSFAEPIKKMLEVILPHPGWLNRKDEPIPDFLDGVTARHLLQSLGSAWGRESIHPNIWVEVALKEARKHIGKRTIVFDDIRFPNEAWAIRRLGHVHEVISEIIHLDRKGYVQESDSHVSEAGLPKHFIDTWITLDGEKEKPH
jgi:hypothetical protein